MRRVFFFSVLLSLLSFVPRVTAQQATTGTFGQGCGHPLDPYGTVLSYTGMPRLGANFTVNYQVPTWPVGRVYGFAFLFTGSSDRTFAGLRLPVRAGDILTGGIGAWHCMIWTSSELHVGFTTGYPQGHLQMMVPSDPGLVGVTLYQQWMIYWLLNYQGSTSEVIYFSNGGVITLGY